MARRYYHLRGERDQIVFTSGAEWRNQGRLRGIGDAMSRVRVPVVLVAALSLTAQTPTIKTRVPLVVVPASVTDKNGHSVAGLRASEFVLLDNGEPQAVQVDDPDTVTAPFQLVVLIQTSDISQAALLKIRQVGAVVQEAVAGGNGEAAVVTFSDEVKLVQNFVNSRGDLAPVFRKLKSVPTRQGRLLDAVAKGLEFLKERPQAGRSALLILGESKDRGSKTKLDDLLPEIQRSGVTIYSLAYSAYLTAFTTKGSEYTPPEGGRGWILDSITEALHASKADTCKILTDASGGEQLKFETRAKLENDLIRLGGDIHSRYILSFTPAADAKPGLHRIQVAIKGRPGLQVVSRPGYWAASETALAPSR